MGLEADLHENAEGRVIGDWVSDFFGKPQSWYDRVSRDQAGISGLLAELNAIGSSLWNEIQGRVAGAIGSGAYVPVSRFTDFGWTQDDLLAQARTLLITKSYAPSDAQLSTAEDRIRLYREMVDYAKSILPEISARVQQEGDLQRQAMNAVALRSPAEVGVDTFYKEIDRRAKELGSGLGTAAFVLAAVLAAFMGWRMSR